MKKIKEIFIYCLLISSFIFLCTNFKSISLSVGNAFNTCINILIPSLFPFFILADYIVLKLSSKKPPKLYKVLFKMPECTFGAYISGLISGYPVGASAVYTLYKNNLISKEDASDLICFSNNTGPLFIISAVGCGMFNDLKSGIILYIIHISMSILTGIIIGTKKKTTKNTYIQNRSNFNMAMSIENSFMKCIKISGFVIFFAIVKDAIINITNLYGESTFITYLIICIIEITEGIFCTIKNCGYIESMCIASFACGFSGLCIFLQTKLVTQGEIPMKKYFLCKLLNGLASSVICYILLTMLNYNKEEIQINNDIIKPLFPVIFAVLTITYIYSGKKEKSRNL